MLFQLFRRDLGAVLKRSLWVLKGEFRFDFAIVCY